MPMCVCLKASRDSTYIEKDIDLYTEYIEPSQSANKYQVRAKIWLDFPRKTQLSSAVSETKSALFLTLCVYVFPI